MDPALPDVINMNRWVDAIVSENWLFIAVMLVMLREISRLTGNRHILGVYQVLGAMFKFLRPSTELREQAPVAVKEKKLDNGVTVPGTGKEPKKDPPTGKPPGGPNG